MLDSCLIPSRKPSTSSAKFGNCSESDEQNGLPGRTPIATEIHEALTIGHRVDSTVRTAKLPSLWLTVRNSNNGYF